MSSPKAIPTALGLFLLVLGWSATAGDRGASASPDVSVLDKAVEYRASPDELPGPPAYVADEIVFKLSVAGDLPDRARQALDRVAARHALKDSAELFPANARGLLRGVFRAHLPTEVSPLEAARRLRTDPDIEWAEPNYYMRTCAVPNDPSYPGQWHLPKISAPLAWDVTRGSTAVVVAIVDTGMQINHPDLAANLWYNAREREGDGRDNDHNGFIDDVNGWDFVSVDASGVAPGEDPGPRDNNPNDFNGHGTFVSGIVGAVGNNSVGVAGVNWTVRLMPVRAGYSNPDGYGVLQSADIAAAVAYATDNGADIISMSFGGGQDNAIATALQQAYQAGVVLVAAVGNGASKTKFYPAALPYVLAVAATDSADQAAGFTSYGSWTDLAAPGVDVLSTWVGSTYGSASGTSAACPVVSGTAALCLARTPGLTNEQVYQVLKSTTDPLSTPIYIGLGRVNAWAAVNKTSVAVASLDPGLDELLTAARPLAVNGTASGSYTLSYGAGVYPTSWIPIASGGPVTNGLLATWTMSGITQAGSYSLRLVVNPGLATQAEDRVVMWVDPTLLPGWPQFVPSTGAEVDIYASPAIADLDSDGVNELFAISRRGLACLWSADGAVLPGWPKTMGTNLQQADFGSPAVANIDGGRDLEIIVTTGPFWNPQINVWKKNGTSPPGWPKVVANYFECLHGPAVGDIDGDGDPEIVVASYDIYRTLPARVDAWHHDGTEVSGWPLEFPGVEAVTGSPTVLADFDGDGVLDVVIGVYSNTTNILTVVNGHGVPLPGWPITPSGIATGCSAGDLDADGDLEIVVTSNATWPFAFDHLGNCLSPWSGGVTCSAMSSPALGDVDGDGKLEFAFQDLCSNIFLCGPDAVPRFVVDTGNVAWIGPPFASSVVFGDVNGDGRPDIVAGAEGASKVYALDLSGQVLPGFPKTVADGGEAAVHATPEITDLNGDGMADLVVAGPDGGVYVWRLGVPVCTPSYEWPRYGNQLARNSRHDWWPLTSVSGAKSSPAGSIRRIRGAAVSAAFDGFFYVESDTRESGIRIDRTGHGLVAGMRANVLGTVKTNSDGERYIQASSVIPNGDGLVSPLGLSTLSLGGRDWLYSGTGVGQRGVAGGAGLNNIGLFIRTWGVVKHVGTDADGQYFYVDDGSRITDPSGHMGVKVRGYVPPPSPLPPGWTPVGTHVQITGISSCYASAGTLYRLIRATDVVLLD